MNPTQQAWLLLLKAHGQNDANDIQMALQDMVNIVAEGLQHGEDILVPEESKQRRRPSTTTTTTTLK